MELNPGFDGQLDNRKVEEWRRNVLTIQSRSGHRHFAPPRFPQFQSISLLSNDGPFSDLRRYGNATHLADGRIQQRG